MRHVLSAQGALSGRGSRRGSRTVGGGFPGARSGLIGERCVAERANRFVGLYGVGACFRPHDSHHGVLHNRVQQPRHRNLARRYHRDKHANDEDEKQRD
jgi:hypothetical protein